MRILLVEDEEKVAGFIVRGLEAESFAVDVAPDGRRAVELATTYEYDLIILDLMLPGLHGTEVLRQVRRRNQQVPVLILTARDALADKVEHFELGADDYLTKPFAFAELLVRVRALLRRGAIQMSGRSNVLRVADLELDRLAQQVRRGGRKIELTGKEYALLEYLMSNAGRVLSRTMIIEHVWDRSISLGCESNGDVTIEGDRARIKQVIVNLVDNAIKYTPEGGAVGVSVGQKNGSAVMLVTDNGTGIPEEALPHLFERFYRVDKARSRQMGGAGLGLAIVKSIVAAHSGQITVESAEGKGSRFRVELPLLRSRSINP